MGKMIVAREGVWGALGRTAVHSFYKDVLKNRNLYNVGFGFIMSLPLHGLIENWLLIGDPN